MILILVPLFLCWGSFLNVFAYRIIQNISLIAPRSFCISCKKTIAWYDNIPVISWILLRGKCRYCKKTISFLYPCIEIITAFTLTLLYLWVPLQFFFAYFIFFSALIVTIRTDLETLLISRLVTLFLAPFGFMFSYFNMLPITFLESVIGSLVGYFFLFSIGFIFKKITKKSGIGQGDFDLLAFIGSFTGLLGCWASLLVGSILGTLFGLGYIIFSRQTRDAKIPFGPFLSFGAIFFVLYAQTITTYVLHTSY